MVDHSNILPIHRFYVTGWPVVLDRLWFKRKKNQNFAVRFFLVSWTGQPTMSTPKVLKIGIVPSLGYVEWDNLRIIKTMYKEIKQIKIRIPLSVRDEKMTPRLLLCVKILISCDTNYFHPYFTQTTKIA